MMKKKQCPLVEPYIQKRTKQRSNEYNFKVFGNERNRKWNEWQGKQKAFPFTGFSGMNNQLSGQLATLEPIDYFMHFLDEEYLNLMIDQTNLYATQQLELQDESMILWQGRLSFRQYNPRKRHKYGIKGYTWNFSVYIGQDSCNGDWSASENVIYKLLGGLQDGGQGLVPGGLMGEGRTLTTDNWYTSVPLALRLLDHKTHLIGTVRLDRKYLPPEAHQRKKSSKLNKGEIVTREQKKGLFFEVER